MSDPYIILLISTQLGGRISLTIYHKAHVFIDQYFEKHILDLHDVYELVDCTI